MRGILEKRGVDLEKEGGYDPPCQIWLYSVAKEWGLFICKHRFKNFTFGSKSFPVHERYHGTVTFGDSLV